MEKTAKKLKKKKKKKKKMLLKIMLSSWLSNIRKPWFYESSQVHLASDFRRVSTSVTEKSGRSSEILVSNIGYIYLKNYESKKNNNINKQTTLNFQNGQENAKNALKQCNTLTQGCLKVHGGVPIVYAFLLILYSQGSIAWSLKNVW